MSRSRSEPKPKIIYTHIDELIRNSPYTKTQTQPSKSVYSCQKVTRGRNLGSTQKGKMCKSTSRHSLNSKEKIVYLKPKKQVKDSQQPSLIKDIFARPPEDQRYEVYCTQVESLYSEMEFILRESKHHFMEKLQNQPNEYDNSLKDLEKLSHCLKEMLTFFLQKNQYSQQVQEKSTILTEVNFNQPENISKLSIQNQKKRKNNRLNHQQQPESIRKPSIYELVLMKKS